MNPTSERGSALLLAILIMALLMTLGLALLGLGEVEVRMSQSDSRHKAVFYLAETGVEDARERLRVADPGSTRPGRLDDELTLHAGGNGRVDFDVRALRPRWDAAGNVTGFSGWGDDVPVAGPTALGDGMYAAFLTNDPVEGEANTADLDGRVMITAIGAGRGRAVEVVQAIVTADTLPMPPAAITLLGPDPEFDGGNSAAKHLTGNDCESLGVGIPGLSVPVVGAIGAEARDAARRGVSKPQTFVSGSDSGVDTVVDVSGAIHPSWLDCRYLLELATRVRGLADVVGDASTPWDEFGTPDHPKVVYIEGDYAIDGNRQGGGLLWVTGELSSLGNLHWEGALFVVGTGRLYRRGGGNQSYIGAAVVADVAGPDGALWTADDCSGPDGVPGTADDGFEAGATWDVRGGGQGVTEYCTVRVRQAMQLPLRVTSFRQR